MKLLMVTVVAQFEEAILKLFKKARIENFSESHIDGFKNSSSLFMTSNWFAGEKGGVESLLFFSFTEDEKIDLLFDLVTEFNQNLETNNPIKVVVVPIEKYI